MSVKLDRTMNLRYSPISDSVMGHFGCLSEIDAPYKGIRLDEDIVLEVIRVGHSDLISGFHIIAVGAHPEWSLLFSNWFSDPSLTVLTHAIHGLQRQGQGLTVPEGMLGIREKIQMCEVPPIFGSYGAPV